MQWNLWIGETLEKLIRRRDPLEIELALEILAQVAAGVTEEQRSHRPIKIRSTAAILATDLLHYLTSHSYFQR